MNRITIVLGTLIVAWLMAAPAGAQRAKVDSAQEPSGMNKAELVESLPPQPPPEPSRAKKPKEIVVVGSKAETPDAEGNAADAGGADAQAMKVRPLQDRVLTSH